MSLLSCSLLMLVVGCAGAIAFHAAFVYLALAGLAGLWLGAAVYLWAGATGRIDPFPLECRRRR